MKLSRVCCWGLALVWLTTAGEHKLLAVAKKPSPPEKSGAPAKKKCDDDHTHLVKRGETLWGVARKYEVSVGELMDLNHMPNDKIHEGQMLKIPQPGPSESDPPPAPSTHIVVKGESFKIIARAHGISQDELEYANPKVDPDHPKPGTKLKLPGPPTKSEDQDTPRDRSAGAPLKYVVRDHDTYSSIAKERGLTVSAIAKANPGVVPERLRPGMNLVLPSPAPVRHEAAPPPAKQGDVGEGVRRKKDVAESRDDDPPPPPVKSSGTHAYVVSHGESPASIAEAFGITVNRLCQINGKKPGFTFKPGSEILVPDRS